LTFPYTFALKFKVNFGWIAHLKFQAKCHRPLRKTLAEPKTSLLSLTKNRSTRRNGGRISTTSNLKVFWFYCFGNVDCENYFIFLKVI